MRTYYYWSTDHDCKLRGAYDTKDEACAAADEARDKESFSESVVKDYIVLMQVARNRSPAFNTRKWK